MSAVYVEIVSTRGSAPRDAGTAMKVTADETVGTIGGGALEFEAIGIARGLMEGLDEDVVRTFALGPGLGQCCGGAVTLRFTREVRQTDVVPLRVARIVSNRPHPRFIWLWGAGHVGRAVIRALHPQAWKVTWVDSAPERFPPRVPDHVTAVPAADMPTLAAKAPIYAHHLIFTYSHDIDLALCAALLRRGAASIGLIGSDTKKARFFRRLREMGLDPTPIICPIGDKSLGKAPEQIATGVVAALEERETA